MLVKQYILKLQTGESSKGDWLRDSRCLSPFGDGPSRSTAKKGDRHVADDAKPEFKVTSGDEPVPLFRSHL